MRALRADAKASGTEISNALNNSISTNQAARNITALSGNLTTLANVAKTPAASFKTTADSISANLGDLAKKAGLSEKEFSKLNEKMLKTTAANNAERSLKQLASAAGLSAGEAKKLAMQMGFSSAEADKMTKSLRNAEDSTDRLAKAKHGLKVAAAAAGVALVAVGGALAVSVREALAADQAEAKLNAVLTATGHAAGFNVEELSKMASSLQNVTTFSDDMIISGMAILATFKNVREEGFERATKAALDMSTVMGTDLNSAMVQIGKALNDPIKGLTALSRVGVSFTEQQKDMIKSLTESGRGMEAQKIILQELESEFGGAAEAAANNGGQLTQLRNTFNDLQEAIGRVITHSDDFTGSTDTLKTKLVELTDWVNTHQDDLARYFEGAVDVVEWIIKRIGVLGNSLQILSAVANGELEVWEAATMGPQEAARWLDIYGDKNKVLAGQLQEQIATLTAIANDEKVFGENRIHYAMLAAQKQKELNALLGATGKQVEDTGKKGKEAGEKTGAAWGAAGDELEDFGGKAKDAWDIFAEGEAKIKKVDQMVEQFYGSIYKTEDAFKALDKQVFETGQSYDVMVAEWQSGNDVLTRNIEDTSDLIEDDFSGMSEYIEDRWKEAYDGMQNILADWIKDGEVSFDSVKNLFMNMLAEMAAAWIMNMGRMALGNLLTSLGGSSGWGSVLGAIGTAISGSQSSNGGGGGGAGGAASAVSTAYSAYQAYEAYLAYQAGEVAAAEGMSYGTSIFASETGGTVAAEGATVAEGATTGTGSLGASATSAFVAAPWILGISLWAQDMMKPDIPPLAELLNSAGIGPEAFAYAIGDTFQNGMDPIFGTMNAFMMDSESLILTKSNVIFDGIRRSSEGAIENTMMYFDAASGGWQDITKAAIAFEIQSKTMGREMAAASIEAKMGIRGLGDELLDVASASRTGLDYAIEGLAELGVGGEDLRGVLDEVGDVISGVSRNTDSLKDELYGLGLATDQVDGIIQDLGFDTLTYTQNLLGFEQQVQRSVGAVLDLDYGMYELDSAIQDLSLTAHDAGSTIRDAAYDIQAALDEITGQTTTPAPTVGGPAPPPGAPPVNSPSGPTVGTVVHVYLDGADVARHLIDSKIDARAAIVADRIIVSREQRPSMQGRRAL
jgi:hypothetical protein